MVSSLSGPLLNLSSRIQVNWASSYFRKEVKDIKKKNGIIILVGAESGSEIIPTSNALTIMKFMNVNREEVQKIYSLDTYNLPAKDDIKDLEKCCQVAESLNRLWESNMGVDL